jgi:hypothetical protein
VSFLKKYWQLLVGLVVGLASILVFKRSKFDKMEDERKEKLGALEEDINVLQSAKREVEKRDVVFDKNRSSEDVKKYWDGEN